MLDIQNITLATFSNIRLVFVIYSVHTSTFI